MREGAYRPAHRHIVHKFAHSKQCHIAAPAKSRESEHSPKIHPRKRKNSQECVNSGDENDEGTKCNGQVGGFGALRFEHQSALVSRNAGCSVQHRDDYMSRLFQSGLSSTPDSCSQCSRNPLRTNDSENGRGQGRIWFAQSRSLLLTPLVLPCPCEAIRIEYLNLGQHQPGNKK